MMKNYIGITMSELYEMERRALVEAIKDDVDMPIIRAKTIKVFVEMIEAYIDEREERYKKIMEAGNANCT